jgi:hypothetical protein
MEESSKRDVETIFQIIIQDHKRSLSIVQDELQTLKLQQAMARVEDISLKNEVLNLGNEVLSLKFIHWPL